MRNLCALAAALELVEVNLCEQFTATDLAKACYLSVSGLQKLFDYAFHFSIGQYISKRKLSAATIELVSTNKSIIDIALDYGYASPEVFSRAFKRFWGVMPSAFRKEHRFSELFPKFEIIIKRNYVMSNRRKVDISHLYDELKKLGGTYVLCADVYHLKPINDTYGHAAGDLVLAETAERIDSEISNEMLMFRIGRDEFVVVTGYSSALDAENLANKITISNGKPIVYDGKEIPVSMRIGINKIPSGGLSYKEILDKMHDTIDKIKQDDVFVGIVEE